MGRIYIDKTIPGAKEAFAPLGALSLFESQDAFTDPGILEDAEVLITRSTTRIDERLLSAVPGLRAVASPTIGTDHVDFAALASYGRDHGRTVPFFHAPGATAGGVADFALAAILESGADQFDNKHIGGAVGIWGFGHCGSALAERLDMFRIPWLAYDPPLQERSDFRSVDLGSILECRVISLHVPLTRPDQSGWPTHHMIGDEILSEMSRRGTILINTSRGAVVDNDALARILETDTDMRACLDVWEGEPKPDPRLVAACFVSTPHCAGSVVEGRKRAAFMIRDAVASFLGLSRGGIRGAKPLQDAPRAPIRHREDLLAIVGLNDLSRRFKTNYLSADPSERAAVFEEVRAGSARHEARWD
ncbi:MAG: hypothetical protein GXP54_04245 [Deltaproteobacteria bacterium]|nr:hypothetical protein [Deltaproteobacteria bacterium]